MSDFTQEILPAAGGLNWDDDRRFFGKGDSEYRLNVIPNQLGNTFSITNLQGNTAYTHAFTHGAAYTAATYKIIGDVYDDNRDAVYIFIASSLGNDSILRFKFSTHTFEKIAWDHTNLGLDEDYPIADGFMIGDWLHFNPRTSSPRAINVQWAYYDFITYTPFSGVSRTAGQYVRYFNKVYVALKTTTSGTPPSVPADYRFVDFCYEDTYPVNGTTLDATVTSGAYFKIRPFYNTPTTLFFAPTASTETDTDYEYNNIRGRRFQFCYRHYIKDQGYTITSPFTDIIAGPTQETNLGEVVGDIQTMNRIDILFAIQYDQYGAYWYDHATLFEFAEVLFREGPDDSWRVADRISHEQAVLTITGTGSNFHTVSFYNDRAYEVVDLASVEKQYNALPVTSRAQWCLDGERSAYGGNVEGRDTVVDVDVTMTTGERAITLAVSSGSPEAAGTYAFTYTWAEDIGKWSFISGTIANTGANTGELLKVEMFGRDWSLVLSSADVASTSAYINAMIRLLSMQGIAGVNGGTVLGFNTDTIPNDPFVIYRYAVSTTSTHSFKVGSFKNGAWHPFCLFYYDEIGRRSEPVVDPAMRVYMETLPEVVGGLSTNYQRYIDWEIAHKPPDWASYWRWGYAGNQTIDKFWQYNIYSLNIGVTQGNGADTWTQIDISPLQDIDNDGNTNLDHYFPNTTIEKYLFQPGDRVRFITTDIDAPATYDLLQVAVENRDYEIKSFDDVNNYIFIDDIVSPATTTTTEAGSDASTIIIEIYRPKKQGGDTVYYEFGEMFQTYTASSVLYHRGPQRDQTSSLSAKGQFNSGDVFVISRIFTLDAFASATEPAMVESYGWSDFHDTVGWGKGKSGVYTGISQKYLNNIRYSNKLQPNSQASGLSTFDFLDYKELSNNHGKITAIRQAGNTLKVYFERNSASVLVNKTQFYNADGVSQILKSDNVLGDVVYSNYAYGTIFPESVYLKDRTVYFYDIYRASYIQDSSNGIEVLSERKMDRYFHEKSAALLASGVSNVKVYTTYDYDRGLVYCFFSDEYDTDNSEAVVYHEASNRWVTFASWQKEYTPPGGSPIDVPIGTSNAVSSFCSYYGQSIYIHHTHATYNYMWGEQRTSIIEVVANDMPNMKKVFETMAIHSNKGWNVSLITIPADETYVNGMESKLPESKFKKREGVFYAPYMRNQKTNQATATTLDLIRGEQLRGYYLKHRLENTDTTEVILFKVDVSGNVSRV